MHAALSRRLSCPATHTHPHTGHPAEGCYSTQALCRGALPHFLYPAAIHSHSRWLRVPYVRLLGSGVFLGSSFRQSTTRAAGGWYFRVVLVQPCGNVSWIPPFPLSPHDLGVSLRAPWAPSFSWDVVGWHDTKALVLGSPLGCWCGTAAPIAHSIDKHASAIQKCFRITTGVNWQNAAQWSRCGAQGGGNLPRWTGVALSLSLSLSS